MAACTYFTGPGGSISENGVGNAFAVLVEPFATDLAFGHFHSRQFLVSWSPGHAAVTVQGQLNGGSPDSLTLCRGLVGKLFHVPLPECIAANVAVGVCNGIRLLFRVPPIQKAGCKGKRKSPQSKPVAIEKTILTAFL